MVSIKILAVVKERLRAASLATKQVDATSLATQQVDAATQVTFFCPRPSQKHNPRIFNDLL